MAEFHRKTRGIVVLHRCLLNQQTWHSTDALSGYQAHLANQGCVSIRSWELETLMVRDAKSKISYRLSG